VLGLHRGRGKIFAVVATPLVLAGAWLLPGSSPAGADVTSVGGGAFGAQADVTLVGLSPVTVGPIPSVTLPATGGGPISDSLLTVDAPGVVTTGVLNVSTQGARLGEHAGNAQSSAQVAGVTALTDVLTANLVTSSCTSNGDGSSATTTLANANVSGIGAIGANPAPNTVVTVADVATITFNEQTRSDVPGQQSSITVNAIHVRLNASVGTGDIVIAQSRCSAIGPDVLAPTTAPPATTAPVNPAAAAVSVNPRFTG
jgi:hypothetical protein